MGALLDCCRDSNNTTNSHSDRARTPDMETRRQAAAEAASRRLVQNETRGVDEDELRRMKQRQAERERIEQQQSKMRDNSGGLRWQMN